MKIVVLVYLFTMLSCSNADDKAADTNQSTQSSDLGASLFKSSDPDGNAFSCSSCHSIEEPSLDGMRRPGHHLADAYKRKTYKNGRVATLLGAVNSCRDEWMNAPSYSESDIGWKNLSSYLQSVSQGLEGKEFNFAISSPPDILDGGSETSGKNLFNGSCAICHGSNAVGSQKAPSLIGTTLTRKEMATRIRTSGSSDSSTYDGLTGGKMPFYTKDRLSDDEMINILSYLGSLATTNGQEDNKNDDDSVVDVSLQDSQSNCGSDHILVGKTLNFATKAHQVSGTATVKDNCTILFSDFNFDGQGVDVRIYTGIAGDFSSGKTISIDLLGMPFSDASVSVKLQSHVSLDDFDSLSVWCVPIGISFGDGIFN